MKRVVFFVLGFSILCFSFIGKQETKKEANQLQSDIQSSSTFLYQNLKTRSTNRLYKSSILQSNSSPYNMVQYNCTLGKVEIENFEIADEDDFTVHKSKAYPSLKKQQGISSKGIISQDERTQVLDPKQWPYSATCFIRSTFFDVYNSNTKSYEDRTTLGSGFMIGPNLFVTAGHCVYSDITDLGNFSDGIYNPRFPDLIEVYAGVNGLSELNNSNYPYYAKVTKIHIQREYYENTPLNYDWAALELNWNLGYKTGYYGKIANWYEQDAQLNSFGYPAEKPQGTMWETNGKLLNKTKHKFEYNLDTTGGQSGSPVFMTINQEAYVCGIHTNVSSSTSNQGTRINDFIFKYLDSYIPSIEIGSITPIEYGFEDAYPVDEDTQLNYRSHITQQGCHFQTRRYRTGYIHNEYIVMSCIRNNINEAFIEYKFDIPVSKIEVELSHWRGFSQEWLDKINGIAEIQYLHIGMWQKKLDLLSVDVNLPTDRDNPNLYTIEFDVPTNNIRFYSKCNRKYINDNNRGRICIGNMTFYVKENN